MIRKTVVSGILLALVMSLAACSGIPILSPILSKGSGEADTSDALPVQIQLLVGTLLLEETPNAVTAVQAQELLPPWQMLRFLLQSDTASQVEIEAVLKQIQAAMTSEQLAAIKEMRLTPTSLREMAQERGLGRGQGEGESSSSGRGGGFGPPGGFGPGGFGPGGMGPGGGTNLSPEEQATAMAERMSSGFGVALIDVLVELLEARAGEESNRDLSSPVASGPTPTGQQPILTPPPSGPTVALSVEAPTAIATATPTGAPTETPTVIATATPTVRPPAATVPPPTERSGETKVVAVVMVPGLNVRGGPDMTYPRLGYLGRGDVAEVVGFHPDSGWLQIIFEEAPEGKGWISGKQDYVTIVGALDAVPMVEALP